jgi:hypothetical protein
MSKNGITMFLDIIAMFSEDLGNDHLGNDIFNV